MKKPSEVLDRDEEVDSLKRRVAVLERTSAALSARMLSLFGPAAKPVDLVAAGAERSVSAPAVR